jgi:hypothetical protein
MSFRQSVFEEVGLFDTDMGRSAAVPLGCEETVLGILVSQHYGKGSVVHVPSATVDHKVGPERSNVQYFVRRCFAEGISKAAVAERVGVTDASSVERKYVSCVLTKGIASGGYQFVRGDLAGIATASFIAVGFMVTAGYGMGRLGLTNLVSRVLLRHSANR